MLRLVLARLLPSTASIGVPDMTGLCYSLVQHLVTPERFLRILLALRIDFSKNAEAGDLLQLV